MNEATKFQLKMVKFIATTLGITHLANLFIQGRNKSKILELTSMLDKIHKLSEMFQIVLRDEDRKPSLYYQMVYPDALNRLSRDGLRMIERLLSNEYVSKENFECLQERYANTSVKIMMLLSDEERNQLKAMLNAR